VSWSNFVGALGEGSQQWHDQCPSVHVLILPRTVLITWDLQPHKLIQVVSSSQAFNEPVKINGDYVLLRRAISLEKSQFWEVKKPEQPFFPQKVVSLF